MESGESLKSVRWSLSVPLGLVSLRFMQPKEPSPCSATHLATEASGVGYCALAAIRESESYTIRSVRWSLLVVNVTN